MSAEPLRAMIREILAEEVTRARGEGLIGSARKPKPVVREERIVIRGDPDLEAFVRRLAEILKDGRSREDIEHGLWVFRLAEGPVASGGGVQRGAPVPQSAPRSATAEIAKGVVSERQVEALPAGATRLVVGRSVRFTPLARDRLRVRGIEIERSS